MAVATEVVARFTADISDVQSKMSMARGAFATVGEAASFSSKRIAEVGNAMADVGKKMTVGITLPLGGVAAAASTAAISFEASMNKIIGLVGIASDEVARMGTEVTGMAGQIGKSPDELAAGLFVVTSAGLRGSDAMATLANSAKAGAAGLGETNDIARAVAGALSAYGTEVLSASEATDAIVATARAGNFETSQFAAAIGRVLPFAKQAGASFQEMGGAVALLTRVNGDAAQSVTQIQALFRAFVVPTEEAKTALDEVGMSAEDLRDSIAAKGLPATLQMLDKALGGNREQLGRLLGSSEAASAAFQILDSDAATIEATFGGVRASAGMTAEAFNAVAQTTQFQMNQAMAQLKATLIDLGNQFLPIIKTVVDFMQANLKAFSSLPGPIKTVITAFAGILAVVGPLLFIVGKLIVVFSGLLSIMLKMRAVGALRLAFAQLRGEMAATRASLKQTQSSIGMIATAANTAKVTVVASFKAIGVAAKGLLASLGPIGLAMIAVGAAFEIFVGKAAGTEHHLANLRDEIDLTTGKMSEAAKIFIASELRHNISQEDLAMLDNYGISISGFIAALEQGGPALDAYREKITAMQEAQKATGGFVVDGFLNVGTVNSINTIVENLDGMIDQYGNAKLAAADLAAAQVDGAVAAADAQRGLMATHRAAAQEKRAADKSMTDSQKALDAALNAGVEAVEGLQKAFEKMNEVISQEASRDSAIQSIKDLNATLEENGNALKGTSDAAMSNRSAIRDAAQGWIDYAAAAKDPEEAQKRLAKGQDEIRAALKKQGIKPEQSDIFKVFKKQQAESKKTVDEFAAQRATAEKYGNEVGMNFIDGILAELQRRKDEVAAAAAAVTSQLTTGGNAGIDATSPSRDAMKVAGNFVDGLIVGLRARAGQASKAASEVARELMKAFMQDFIPRDMGAAESAIANAIEGALEKLRYARMNLKDANRSVKDAERELNRLRKDEDATAKAIARAEKELAKAREEAAKAAKDVKIAEWVKSNEKALNALQKIGKQYDYIVGRMEGVESAFASITSLLATPLGTASDLSQMFQFGTDPRTLARNYMGLADTIREAYAVMTDPAIVGEGAARRNTAAMNATLSQLESYVTQIIALESEYAANAEQMRVNEQKYRVDEEKLRESLSGSVRAYEDATRELERIVNERDGFIDKINSGFRSFVNNLSGLTQDSVSVVTEEVRELGNGVRTIVRSTRQEMQSGAGAIAATLRSRLDEVKAFSSNIQSLMRRGLDPTLIRDFIEAGVSGAGEAVAALASATDDELRGINDTQAELLKYANEFAGGVSGAYYSSAISAQEAIVRDTKAAVTAAQKDLDDAKEAYDAERVRLEGEQTRIETDINTLVTQIESLITGMMTTLVPATEAAAQKSLDAMIAQFKKDFPKVSAELNRLMDALATSMERTVKIVIEPVRAGATTRAGITSVTDVPATVTTGGVPAPAANVTYQITVNTGVGDPREIGRVAVEAIKAYERSNGRVFASA
jgi:TP901 family phage tail tape measure protein